MRIAWIGGAAPGGGVGGFGRMLVSGLLERGFDVTLFSYDPFEQLRELLGSASNLTIIHEPLRWEWNRWYSRHPIGVFLSSSVQRVAAYKRLVRRLVELNHQRAFDVVLQFSQTEIFNLADHLDELPPVLLLPCVHAAGELRWHRKESAFALRSEPWWRHRIVRANLAYRAALQRKTLAKVYGQIGMSRRFNELMQQDYGVRPERQAVVYQPMPPQSQSGTVAPHRKVKLLYVGRISVRKGIDLLIELSHRLNDLKDQVELEIIGGPSFWSDYSKHLRHLNPAVAKYVGSKPHEQIISAMAQADLLLVPSQYEPGGIVVAEALSQGCRVVVSHEVGSAEPLSDTVCYRFPAGDMDAFERTCRAAVEQSMERRDVHRTMAVQEAINQFGLDASIRQLMCALDAAAQRQPLNRAEMAPLNS